MKKMWNQIGQSWSLVDEIEIFDNDDKATKHSFFLRMFCGLVIIIKNFNFTNSRRPWLPNLISHLFILAFFISWLLLFLTLGVLWLRYTYKCGVYALTKEDAHWHRLVCTWFLKIAFVHEIDMYMCLCVCVCLCLCVCVCVWTYGLSIYHKVFPSKLDMHMIRNCSCPYYIKTVEAFPTPWVNPIISLLTLYCLWSIMIKFSAI